MENCVERYHGHVGISGAWLSGLLGKANYENLIRRGHIRSLRRGGNGRTALVDWDSMGLKMKARVIEVLGCDPASVKRETLLRQILERRSSMLLDMGAYEYYEDVRTKDGRSLKPEKVTELWNGARILDAITELLNEKKRAAAMGRLKMSVKREFEALAFEIDQQLVEYPNGLPTSGDRLRKKYNEYMLHGYEVLVHGLVGKKSNHKGRSEEEKAMVERMVGMGNKLNDVQVSKALSLYGVEIDRRRVQEIRKENEAMLMMDREGKRAYQNGLVMQVDRVRPDMPLKMWSLDGWTAELFYQERTAKGVSHWKRLVVEMVVDVMTDYPIGYAIGEVENADLITAALKNAVHHTRELFGGYYAPHQIQSDHFSLKAMTPKYGALAKYVIPASVGNAKAKPVERYFRHLEDEYLWVLVNNAGHNITAKSHANDEYLNKHKYYFPDREGVEKQISQMIQIERSQKIAAMREAWEKGDASMRRPLNMEGYLLNFGEEGKGNMLTANGLKVIRGGEEFKFDCFDIEMRKHAGERWVLHYDLDDMNQALAVSEDGRMRFMMEAKRKVPMALVDYEEEDWKALARYREFNTELSEAVIEHREEVRVLSDGYVTRAELESPASALLLTEKGQHKTAKRKAQMAKVDYTEYEVVEDRGAGVKPEDIFDEL